MFTVYEMSWRMPKGKYDRTKLLLVEATEPQGDIKIIYKRDSRIIRILKTEERLYHRYAGAASFKVVKKMREALEREAKAMNL